MTLASALLELDTIDAGSSPTVRTPPHTVWPPPGQHLVRPSPLMRMEQLSMLPSYHDEADLGRKPELAVMLSCWDVRLYQTVFLLDMVRGVRFVIELARNLLR